MIPKKFHILILFAALALAHAGVLRAQGNPDSGKWPWKLPFTISLNATFVENEVTKYDTGYPLDGCFCDIVFDTTSGSSGVSFSVGTVPIRSNDTSYTFNWDSTFGNGEWTYTSSLSITFDASFDSILTLNCSQNEVFESGSGSFNIGTGCLLRGMRFNDTSIIYPDSTLSLVEFSYGLQEEVLVADPPYLQYATSVTVSQITLGGILSPITLSAPATVSLASGNSNIPILSYPNPFSHSTTISFSSQSSGYADISIVNLLGAEVAHLFSGELAAGEHSFVWSNPTGVPDGTYECLIRMNGHLQTLPMVLMH